MDEIVSTKLDNGNGFDKYAICSFNESNFTTILCIVDSKEKADCMLHFYKQAQFYSEDKRFWIDKCIYVRHPKEYIKYLSE